MTAPRPELHKFLTIIVLTVSREIISFFAIQLIQVRNKPLLTLENERVVRLETRFLVLNLLEQYSEIHCKYSELGYTIIAANANTPEVSTLKSSTHVCLLGI